MEENKNLEVEQTEDTETEEVKTYTEEEVRMLLQKEGDRRVSSARNKWEQEKTKAVSEAEKLAKMDEEARKMYELEQREKELLNKERELTLNANRVECSRIMSSKGLPLELVDFVVSEDADEMNDRIKLFERVINDTVSKEVLARIGSDAPQTGAASTTGLTRENFAKMSLKEQMDIYERDPELYKKLSQ